jgi:hypothetical protein
VIEELTQIVAGVATALAVSQAMDEMLPDYSPEYGPTLLVHTDQRAWIERPTGGSDETQLRGMVDAETAGSLATRYYGRHATVDSVNYGSPLELVLVMTTAAATSAVAFLQWVTTRRVATDKARAEADQIRAETIKTARRRRTFAPI